MLFVAACLLTFLAFVAPAQSNTQGLELQLEVAINGVPRNLIGAFTQLPRGRIGATAIELAELGIRVPAGQHGSGLVVLDDIPGVTYSYSPQMQTIDIRVGDASRTPKMLDARSTQATTADIQANTTGAVFNYALFASAGSDFDNYGVVFDGVSALLDSRFFGPYGTLMFSGIARGFSGTADPLLRLDTTWNKSDPENLVTYRLGDIISGGLSWTRPVRMGGLQAQRNFVLRPDLITMPLPSFSGSAAVPSTVDVYVNSAKAYSSEVPPGPFEINNIPVVSGAGAARVVLRDASGRETVTTAPFYASSSLLRAGIYDFSVETGFARRNYGIESDDYWVQPIGSLSWRYGITDSVTAEGHAEVGSNLINAGAGAATRIAAWGKLSGALSISASDGRFGGQVYGALDFQLMGFDGRVSSQRSIGDYADLASVTAESDGRFINGSSLTRRWVSALPPRAVDQFSIGIPMPYDKTRLALNIVHIVYEDETASNIVSASYSRPLGNDMTFLATAFNDFSPTGGMGLYLGVMVPLGANASATASVIHDRNGTGYGVEAMRPLGLEPGSVGWQARVTSGEYDNALAAAAYRGEKATLQGRVISKSSRLISTAEMTGSVAATKGSVFFANRIDDAFAVVDVGAADVDVLYENRRVAVTDSDGKALVTGLRSYQKAKISIDPANLPVGADIPRTEIEVAPADRSGVAVDFGVRRDAPSALVVFRSPDGAFIPAGTRGHIEGREGEFAIGYDGQAFLKGLDATTKVVVGPSGQECRATFSYARAAGVQTIIDPVVCRR